MSFCVNKIEFHFVHINKHRRHNNASLHVIINQQKKKKKEKTKIETLLKGNTSHVSLCSYFQGVSYVQDRESSFIDQTHRLSIIYF